MCQTCLTNIDLCLFQTCGNACFGGLFDAGAGAPHCNQLGPCCSRQPTTAEQMACAQVLVGQNDAACQQALAMYGVDGGQCP
jgi:hypothetical protein